MKEQEVNQQSLSLSVDLVAVGAPPSELKSLFPDLMIERDFEFLNRYSSDHPALVIVCEKLWGEAVEILSKANWCSYFVLSDKWTISEIENLFLRPGFSGALSTVMLRDQVSLVSKELNELLRRASAREKTRLHTQELKRLEIFNQELETVVAERTQIFEESKTEEDARLLQTRRIVKSIQDLSQIQEPDEILLFLKKELKAFHGTGEILVIEWSSTSGNDVASLQWISKEQMQFSQVKLKLDLAHLMKDEIRIISSAELAPLSQVFHRPVGSGLLLTIDEQKKRFILVESFFSENELPEVHQYLADRVLPLSLTFDRVMIEKEILASIVRWEESFDSVQDALAIVSHTYEVARSNKAFENYKGSKCFEILLNRKEPCENCPLRSNKKSNQVIIQDKKVYELSSSPLVIDDLPQLNYYSIHLYSDRTESRDLSARVLQSEKMAALGELSAHIAHELNNPLTGIRSMVQILLNDRSLPSTTKEDLIQIESGTERAQKIIDNLMSFTQGETGKPILLSGKEVVESTLPFIKTALRDHKYHIVHGGQQLQFLAELPLMQQVLFNLINNASQAMEKSGELWVETGETRSQDKTFCFIDVKDSGPGIPIALREKVFEPLFTTKQEGSGTGLGLALSRKIVEAFGGQIQILDSEHGAHFRVIFEAQVKK